MDVWKSCRDWKVPTLSQENLPQAPKGTAETHHVYTGDFGAPFGWQRTHPRAVHLCVWMYRGCQHFTRAVGQQQLCIHLRLPPLARWVFWQSQESREEECAWCVPRRGGHPPSLWVHGYVATCPTWRHRSMQQQQFPHCNPEMSLRIDLER